MPQPAAGNRNVSSAFRFPAIGTHWQIDTERELPERTRQAVLEAADEFDRVWSRFRDDSLITRIARAGHGGRFEIAYRDLPLLDLYDRLVDATEGAVDPLVGRDLELYGYDARYILTPDLDRLRSRGRPLSWREHVRRDGVTIVTEQPVVIDVGAAGKGFLVDRVAELLEQAGVDDYLVNGSGDLHHSGSTPIVVGLEHPTIPDRVIGRVALQNAALCASATTRRSWGEGLHHILDGRTREPAGDVVASWVIASDAATADGLATALFLSDPDALDAFEFSWVRMLGDGRVQWSNNFHGELFI